MKSYVFEKLDSDFHIDNYTGIGFPQDRLTLHFHPYHEFSLISSGDITYATGNLVSNVSEKCFIFSRAYQLHNPYINPQKQYERYQIMFMPNLLSLFIPEYKDVLSPLMSNSGIWRVSDTAFSRMELIMSTLLERYENDRDSKSAQLEYRLLTSELMLLATDVVKESSSAPNSLSDTYIGNVVKYIHEHYENDIKISDLASQFFMSETKLTNDFKKRVGMTVGKYLTLTRVESAKKLLRRGYSVNVVAARCGFQNTSYFIKVFYRHTLLTPLKYQQCTYERQ